MVGINSHIFRSIISIQIPSKASVLWIEQHCVPYSSFQWPYKHVDSGHLFYLELLVLTVCIIWDCTGSKLTHYFYLYLIYQNYLLKIWFWNSCIRQNLGCSIRLTYIFLNKVSWFRIFFIRYFLRSTTGEPFNCVMFSHSLCPPLKFKSRKSNYSLGRASTTLYTSSVTLQSLLYICIVLENTIRWEYMWELDNTPAFESVTKNFSYCIIKEMYRLKSTSNSTCVRRDPFFIQ